MPKLESRVLALSCLLFATVAGAQQYPTKPVRVIVPVAAGGNVDIIARTLAAKFSESLGHQVIVDNRPSASSLVGTQLVAKSPPDGYTLLAIANTFASAPGIVSSAGYDPVNDFVGVSQTARIPMVLDVNPNLPVKSVKELIALAKARPGQLAYASSGTGSTGHIAAELFSRQAGVKMLHVPYKGNAQSLVDLIGGQVMVMFDQISTSTPHIRSGKIRPLGVTTLTRAPLFPDLPTIDESGLKGFEDVTFNGLVAPAGTPAAIVTRLHGETVKAVKQPDVRKRFEEQGIELAASQSADAFTAYIRSESAKYAKLAKEAGIRAD
ncbi:MAG TPA: tripartite tricarboxylate transporter substrate binding protein [Burkholderiales bacterium]|nr:tripartite tricarboxylate transporter substrate binding protein [Burkholderiales bacterium]